MVFSLFLSNYSFSWKLTKFTNFLIFLLAQKYARSLFLFLFGLILYSACKPGALIQKQGRIFQGGGGQDVLTGENFDVLPPTLWKNSDQQMMRQHFIYTEKNLRSCPFLSFLIVLQIYKCLILKLCTNIFFSLFFPLLFSM